MAQIIKLKNSSVAAKVPLTTDLVYGEVALNYADGKLYYKKSDGTIQSISGSGGGGGGSGGVWTKITTATTATSTKQYLADTTAAAFTVTLPASPVVGDYVYFMDVGTWATNNLTVARNGSTIEGSPTDLVFDVSSILVQMIYDGTTWQVASNLGPQGIDGPPGTLTSVIGTAPIVSSVSGSTATVSMAAATASVNGYLTSADWNTFNNKQAAGASAAATTIGTTAPASPVEGQMWYDTTDGTLFIRSGSIWVEAVVTTTGATGASANPLPVGTTAQRPSSPVQGSMRINSETNYFETYYNSNWFNLTYIGMFTATSTNATITYSGNYAIHTFLTSGSFTPTTVPPGGTIDYLIVAGGGGGGAGYAGGGGAGGFITGILGLTSGTTYTVTVGAGGIGYPTSAGGLNNGSNGGNSLITGLNAAVGGGGGGGWATPGAVGGSGGGGAEASGGAGIVGQGNAGGLGYNGNPNYGGGGGGGAGGAGTDGTGTTGGNGGTGLPSTISGSSVYYAGGGGASTYQGGTAGSGGTGGGAAGGVYSGVGNNAIANTGGGGGGGGWSGANTQLAGGNGGSGIVIIRYRYQ